MKHFIVRLYIQDTPQSFFFVSGSRPIYLADFEGDPGRTHSPWNAKKFETEKGAQEAIEEVLKDYPNRNYSPKILTIEAEYFEGIVNINNKI